MRKGLLNLTTEETVKLLGVVVIASFAFVLVFWGVGRAGTFGEYIEFTSRGGDVVISEEPQLISGELQLTVAFTNTAEEEQEMWLKATARRPGGNPTRAFLSVEPNEEERVTLAPGETMEKELKFSHPQVGCHLEIEVWGECGDGGILPCSHGRELNTFSIDVDKAVGAASRWEGKCS